MNIKEFSALLYRNDSSEGKPVTVIPERYQLKVRNDIENFSLPISGIDFKLGGDESGFLVAKGKDHTLLIKDNLIFDELIKNSNQAQVEKLTKLKASFNKKKHGRRLLPVIVLSSIAAIIFFIYISLNIFTNVIVHIIPVSWEKSVGDAAVASMIRGKTVDNPGLIKSVEEVGKYLESKGNNPAYKLKFFVVNDKQVNAFALPGGNIIINTGLLQKAESPEELAGVMAHEIEHVYQKHGTKRIIKRFGLSVTLSLLFGDIGSLVDSIGGDLASLKFDRDEEREADIKGLDLLYNSGIEPQAMVSFFRKLKEVNKDLPDLPSFISSHPSTDNRITELQGLIAEKYSKLPYKKEFKIDWKKVRELAKK